MVWPFSKIAEEMRETQLRAVMIQREIQMAVNVAKARDTLQWFGGLYSAFAGAVTLRALTGGRLPGIVGVPLVMGGFGLANLADMVYGTKLVRVRKEAERILDDPYQRARLFVPPKQAPFYEFYGPELPLDEELNSGIGPVGFYWPGFLGLASPPFGPFSKEE
uniref:Plasminogen receptor (KT) n=1 Tax=Phaeomonas parva TaxID=124430 RepID=A0A7S1UDC7_9STRA|mmetsp:Transcript_42138/g.132066  ORF Transcript_42138/g.132066 Transcript_42138/m.132066 type:complete len:163 (+) Transcript_42138:103-591(+)|eukprot:CAMPEP_0118882796 /NCGR_PEP_ID=MMETSP1163-20130328/21979_1 /TAXON_ID=124430 /ORGANISM="Phaeomonas parva, Strain CCMP2877" /LENGTH=162 /DNA_ID=CAMNT_0006819985 /DNA_START=83 /DNA_END=571 /DNA_ORIENTATION=+